MRPVLLAVTMCAAFVGCTHAGKASSDTTVIVRDTVVTPLRPVPPPPITRTVALTFDGIAPLRIGMSVDQARAAVPGFALRKGADEMACGYAATSGFPRGVTVMVDRGSVRRVDVDTPDMPTGEGARVGDTEQRVRSLYPGVVSTPHKYADRGHYLTVRNPADTMQQVIFETDGLHVLRLRAGRMPQVAYVEGCS